MDVEAKLGSSHSARGTIARITLLLLYSITAGYLASSVEIQAQLLTATNEAWIVGTIGNGAIVWLIVRTYLYARHPEPSDPRTWVRVAQEACVLVFAFAVGFAGALIVFDAGWITQTPLATIAATVVIAAVVRSIARAFLVYMQVPERIQAFNAILGYSSVIASPMLVSFLAPISVYTDQVAPDLIVLLIIGCATWPAFRSIRIAFEKSRENGTWLLGVALIRRPMERW